MFSSSPFNSGGPTLSIHIGVFLIGVGSENRSPKLLLPSRRKLGWWTYPKRRRFLGFLRQVLRLKHIPSRE